MLMNNLKFVPNIVTGRLSEEDAKRYFSRFGWFVFAYFLINIIAQNAIALIVYYVFPKFYFHYLFAELLSFVPNYLIALPLAYAIVRPLPSEISMKEKMSVGHIFCGFCISMTLMMVGNYISQIFIGVFQVMRGSVLQNPVEAAVASMPLWMNFLSIVVLAPVLEELVFRGLMCKKLLVLGEGYAIILSAAVFALCHGNFFQLFYAFTLGCFFAFIYVKTGKLVYTVFFHMAINFLGGFVAPWLMSFIDASDLVNGELMISADNILQYLALMWYELIALGAAIFGLVLLIKKRRQFTVHTGILPPPEKRGVSCVLLNSGVAAAITIFALTLVGSLL